MNKQCEYDVVISASGRFFREVDEVAKRLRDMGLSVVTPDQDYFGSGDNVSTDEKCRLTSRHIENIRNSYSVLIVSDKSGYVGISVALEVGFAVSKNKGIFSIWEIKEIAVGMFVKTVSDYNEIAEYCHFMRNGGEQGNRLKLIRPSE